MLGGKLPVGCKGPPRSSWRWLSGKHCQFCGIAQQRTHAKQINRGSAYCHAAAKPGSGITEADRQCMRQALALARRGLGKTEPNPAVGCVIVKDGKLLGEGYHPKAGEPHAEVFALRAAGQAAEGATAYVTLEPCNHYGRTPPCSQALVAAKVARVVVGVGDPNPLVGGAGIATCERAGIEVAKIGGQEERECYALNEDFMERMKAQT